MAAPSRFNPVTGMTKPDLITKLESKTKVKDFLAFAQDKLVVLEFKASWLPPSHAIRALAKTEIDDISKVIFASIDIEKTKDETEHDEDVEPTYQFYKNEKFQSLMSPDEINPIPVPIQT